MFSTDPTLAATVRSRMIAALGAHSPIDEARITVDMKGSCAVLHGCVRSWRQRQALEHAALETAGVARVDNQLALLIEAHLADRRDGRCEPRRQTAV